jgi:hypothetical protein
MTPSGLGPKVGWRQKKERGFLGGAFSCSVIAPSGLGPMVATQPSLDLGLGRN